MYADIALPIAQGAFTFEVPPTLDSHLECGSIVAVSLGARRHVGGVVMRLHDQRPDYATIKPVEEVLFAKRVITPQTLQLWEWMADYYMCSLGEVVRAALPSLLKPAGLTEAEFRASLFRPRQAAFVRPVEGVVIPHKCRKQAEVYEWICANANGGLISRTELLSHGYSSTIINKLRDIGAIAIEQHETTDTLHNTSFDTPSLSEAQSLALAHLEEGLRHSETALLRGVAGSGKSEIVMTLAARALAKGNDVLWLVPETALSSHFAERLKRTFGDSVLLYHSGLTPRRRSEIVWQLSTADAPRLVVGVRSSVLLPIQKLGVVVVDEEYDTSYKQTDTAPRYSARDCAIMLASAHKAKTILCAATPSMESYANALGGKYAHITLEERFGGGMPPIITVSDTRKSAQRGERRSFLNLELRNAINQALEQGTQTILFQERRGTASYVECECGWSPRCDRCNIALAVHGDKLVCHYCGRSYPLPESCPRCGSAELRPMGTGTQQIEQYVRSLYPQATVSRLDRDTASSPARIREIIEGMESGRTDILVGTRLITKGFDFERVTVTGILNADNLLCTPDFRASERALQTIMQAAGRAGRRKEQGMVVIQTSEPRHPIVVHAAQGDYEGAARTILEERRNFNYPPFCRLINIEIHSEWRDVAIASANDLAQCINIDGVELLGPQPTNQEGYGRGHTRLIILKIAKCTPLAEIKKELLNIAAQIRRTHRKATITFNVDPQ